MSEEWERFVEGYDGGTLKKGETPGVPSFQKRRQEG